MAEIEKEMDLDMDMEMDIITLLDMDNNDVDFYHVATIDYEGKWYVFLQPVSPIEGIADDEVIIYELGADEEGDDKFIPIENDELLDKIFQEYLAQAEADECGCGDDCECGEDCGCGDCDSTEDCSCGDCDCTEAEEVKAPSCCCCDCGDKK